MQGTESAASGAVVPGEAEERTDGVGARIAGVERVQHGDAGKAERGQREIGHSRREPES